MTTTPAAPTIRRRGWQTGHRVAAVALAAAGVALAAGAASAAPPLAERLPAPAVTLDMVQPAPRLPTGRPHPTLRDLRGQVAILIFLDDTCPGCNQAADTAGYFNGSGLPAIGIATGIDRRRAAALAKTKVGRGTRIVSMAADPDRAIATAFGITTLPAAVVLDRRGRIAERLTTIPAPEDLITLTEPLRAEPIPGGITVTTRPRLSVFRRSGRPTGPIPRSLRPRETACPYLPGTLRLAARSGPIRLLVARGLDGGITMAMAEGGVTSTGCGTASNRADRQRELNRIRTRGIVAAFGSGPPNGDFTLGLVLTDGWTEVIAGGRTYPVQDNGVIIRDIPQPSHVILRGPAGTRRVQPFG